MVEVKLDFSEVSLVPESIIKIELDGKEVKFVNNTVKIVEKDNSKLSVSNVVASNFVANNERVSIHIVTQYINLDTKEKVIVHERSYGEISSVSNSVKQTDFASYQIILDEVDLFDYTYEIKTKEEELEDKLNSMQEKIDSTTKEIGLLRMQLIKANGKFDEFRNKLMESCKY